MAGTVIYEAHPAMFRAHPFWFILCVLLIAAFGIGILDSALLVHQDARHGAHRYRQRADV